MPDWVRERVMSLRLLHEKMSRDRFVSKLASRYMVHEDQAVRLIGVLRDEREALELLSVTEDVVMKSIRVNTIKVSKKEVVESLGAKGVELGDHPYVSYGLVVYKTPVSLSALHEHLMGYYYIQGPASMLPVLALDPAGLEIVLDSCSGAGGKTTQIAQHNPRGLIVSVDSSPRKLLALKNNLSRLGVYNVVSVRMDARRVDELGRFPGALLDAPCSGDGLTPFPKKRRPRSNEDVLGRVELQIELLDSIARALKPGGSVVYSTCSTSFEENEFVVSVVSERRGLDVVETGLPVGEEGVDEYYGLRVDSSVRRCRRLYPHKHMTEGFTICKLVKRP